MKSLESGSELDLNKFAKGDKTLFVVITSSMGLCGGYNLNIYKKFIPLYQKMNIKKKYHLNYYNNLNSLLE